MLLDIHCILFALVTIALEYEETVDIHCKIILIMRTIFYFIQSFTVI